jgi:antitoxin VapB
MALKIEDRPKDAAHTAMRDPIVDAILERLRLQPPRDPGQIEEALRAIGERCSKLPVLDDRSPDEILGYGEDGLPH